MRIFVIIALVVLFMVTACNLPFKAASNSNSPTDEGSPSGGLFGSLEKPTPTKTIDPKPVGIQEGLGSLDSYRLRIQINSSDSGGKLSNYDELIERDVVNEATHSHEENTSFDPEYDSEESTSTTDTYEIGLVTCSKSDDEDWSYAEMTEEDKEILDTFKKMIDILPVISNPTLVGQETVNGIESNHFTFKVEGIGVKSGAVATTNEGEYWLAVDGQYLVKYSLELEIHSSDNATSNKLEVLMDLTDVNSSIDIQQPEGCVKTEE